NGVRDTGEAAIGGVLVTLSGAGTGTATTAADGSYQFTNLDAGRYSVTAPTTASGKALSTTNPQGERQGAGEEQTDGNFGYVPGSLSGFVYVDTNRNGVRDTGEAAIGGVIVTLSGAGAGTATTAADGSYSFANLDAGTYSVTAPTTASGKALSTTNPQ